MRKKLYGTAKYLNKVYTLNGGEINHEDKIETKGIIKLGLHLNPAHKPHDGRKHFITMAKKYKVDEYAIKYMVGHEISDLTERIYTKREISWLKEEIEKIK